MKVPEIEVKTCILGGRLNTYVNYTALFPPSF